MAAVSSLPALCLWPPCRKGFLRVNGSSSWSGFGGSKRYTQLTGLSKEWQAKAERGEIPRTTPGGPKVWRDELGTGAGTA